MTDAEKKKKVVSQYQVEKLFDTIKNNFTLKNPSTTPSSPSSSVSLIKDLKDYEEEGKSFTYDAETTYIYDGNATSHCSYVDEETSVEYLYFKVQDVDAYLVYTINDDELCTYSSSLTSSSLPSDVAGLFEVGSYALVHQLTNATTDTFYPDKVAVFTDEDGGACRHIYIGGIDYADYLKSTENYMIAVSHDEQHVYVYRKPSGKDYYRCKTAYHATATLPALLATYKALKALVDCAGSFDSEQTYPDGTIGKELTNLAQNMSQKADVRKVLSADDVETDAEDSSRYITIDADTPDEVLDWRGQTTPLNVYFEELCRNEVTIYFSGDSDKCAVLTLGDNTQSIGDINISEGYEYCMVIQDDVYIIAPMSSTSTSTTSE